MMTPRYVPRDASLSKGTGKVLSLPHPPHPASLPSFSCEDKSICTVPSPQPTICLWFIAKQRAPFSVFF